MGNRIICISISIFLILSIILTTHYFSTKVSLTLLITSPKEIITDESYKKANSSIKKILKDNEILLYRIETDKENNKIKITFKNKANFSLRECLNNNKLVKHDLFFKGVDKYNILSINEIRNIEYSEEPIDSSNKKSPHAIITLTDEGKARFSKITEESIGKEISIYYDGELVSSPISNQKIESDTIIITFGPNNLSENTIKVKNIVSGIKNTLFFAFPFNFEIIE